MDKQERIVCAAIQFTAEHSVSKDNFEYVLCGVGYKEIKRCMLKVSCDPVLLSKDGFITTKNRFVDAKEAMKIAIEGGQIKDIAELDFIIKTFEERVEDGEPEDRWAQKNKPYTRRNRQFKICRRY